MFCTQNCLFPHKSQQLIIFFLFLMISSSIHYRFMAEGRTSSKLAEAAQMRNEERVMRSLIGSRPPRCEGRCYNCRHCEAVQVPVAPQIESQKILRRREHIIDGAPKTTACSRGDDISNYKPMCWKCKCRDFIFNP
ncbi:hypothetical protein LguiB_019852 [Lonicera macranthoides]